MRSPRHETGPPDLTTAEGFGTFYEDHIDAVLGFVTRRVADPHLAADLTADIFLAAMGSAARTGVTGEPRSPGCSASPGTSWPVTPAGKRGRAVRSRA